MPSGHLSREGSGSFNPRHGRLGRALSSPDTWLLHHGDSNTSRYPNGFSSSCYEDQHLNYRHSPQRGLTQKGGSGGRGGGGGGGSTSRNISGLHHQQQSPPNQHIGDRGSHDQTHDLRDEVGGTSKLGMTVQDLKHMTAMRMGHPGVGGAGGGGSSAGHGGGNVGGAIGDGKGSGLSSSAGSQTADLLSNSSRHRTGLIHHGGGSGQDTSPRPTSAPQHMLCTPASLRESRQAQQRQQQQQQQQHDLPPPPSVLARRASAHATSSGSPRYSHQQQQQQPSGGRGQMTARGSEMMSGHHQLPQRGINRGVSAPRLYASAPDDQISSGGQGGGGGTRPFGPGLSVEELKEMTKLRLQQQQQGRSSPSFAGRPPSNGGLGGGLGISNGGGSGRERTEWRRSNSAGSTAMMEEHHRAMLDDGTSVAPAPFRRASVLAARGMLQADHANAAMHGRRVVDSSGRMEIALTLEDRMRTVASEAGSGGVSPRILSQPSSPSFSANSQSSSACTSPGGGRFHREGRNGGGSGSGGRYGGGGGGGGGGSAYSHAAHVPPPGFADGCPTTADGVYPTVTFPLSGDGGKKGLWPTRHDGGRLGHGFPNGDRPLHDVRSGGGRRHGRSGSTGGSVANSRIEGMDMNGAAQPLGGRSFRQYRSFEDEGSGGRTFRGRNGALVGVASSFQAPTAVAKKPLLMQTIGRPVSASLSPPGMIGSSVSDSLSDPGNGSGSLLGVRSSFLRRPSYNERKDPHLLDLQDGYGGGSGGGMDFGDHRAPHLSRSMSRPTDLRLYHGNIDHPPRPQSTGGVIGESSSMLMLSAVGTPSSGSPWVRVGAPSSASTPAATEDVTAMMCAEFALLTPKSALQQQQQQQQHIIDGSPMRMWPPSWGEAHDSGEAAVDSASLSKPADVGVVGGAQVGHHVRGGRSVNDASVGSGRALEGSQGSRAGSEVSSPEGPQASKGAEDLDEHSSTGSGGGGRQGSVHVAFGALDAAVGLGGGGGGEANVGGGGFDGSFPDNADGDSGRNGGTGAQSYDRSLMKPTSFFGEDLPNCEGMGLEDESSLSRGGRGSPSGVVAPPGSKVASAGPVDGTTLAVAMNNQLLF